MTPSQLNQRVLDVDAQTAARIANLGESRAEAGAGSGAVTFF